MPIPLTQMQAARRLLSELTERARATDDPVDHMQADCLLAEMLADAAYKSAYIGRWDLVREDAEYLASITAAIAARARDELDRRAIHGEWSE